MNKLKRISLRVNTKNPYEMKLFKAGTTPLEENKVDTETMRRFILSGYSLRALFSERKINVTEFLKLSHHSEIKFGDPNNLEIMAVFPPNRQGGTAFSNFLESYKTKVQNETRITFIRETFFLGAWLEQQADSGFTEISSTWSDLLGQEKSSAPAKVEPKVDKSDKVKRKFGNLMKQCVS